MASIRSSATDTLATAGTSHEITLPTGYAAGDLLVMFIRRSVWTLTTITSFTGWTEKYTGGLGLTVWAKVAVGDEGATATFTTSANCAHAVVTYAVKDHFGDLTAIEASTGTTGSTSQPNADSLTTSWGAEPTLWISAHGHYSFVTSAVSSYPSGYTLGQSTVEILSGSEYYSMTTAAKLSQSTSENPGELTMDSAPASWRAATIGIRPNVQGTLFWSFP